MYTSLIVRVFLMKLVDEDIVDWYNYTDFIQDIQMSIGGVGNAISSSCWNTMGR